MDKFVRIEKPITRAHLQKRKLEAELPQPPKPPKLEEWADVVSEEASLIDISELTDKQVEDVLRLFDLNPTYGPFVGVDRLFRWHRAEDWGLKPPAIIREIIETRKTVSRREGGSLW